MFLDGALPDLSGFQFSVWPQTIEWGKQIHWSADVQNTGTQDAAPYRVVLALSADDTIDAGDFLFDASNGYADYTCNTGGGCSIVKDYTLPASPPEGFDWAGTYRIGMIIDPDNAVAESDETNNSNVGQVAGADDNQDLTFDVRPDVTTTSVSVTQTPVRWGEPLTWSATITNQGTADAEFTTATLYMSTDPTIDAGDYKFDNFTYKRIDIQSLAKDDSVTVGTTYTLPMSPPAGFPQTGTVYFGIVTYTTLEELDYANDSNQGDGVDQFSLDLPKAPDMSSRNLTIPQGSSNTWGGTIDWSADIDNLGTDDAGPFDVVLVLSKDSVIDSGDYLFDAVAINSLGKIATQQIIQEVTLPDAPPAGFDWSGGYYLGLIIDPQNTVTELHKDDNNTSPNDVRSLSIMGQGDLLATEMTVTPTQTSWGQSVVISGKIANQGTADIHGALLQIWLSADTTIELDDYTLSIQQPLEDTIIGAKQEVSFQATVMLPESNLTGLPYVGNCYIGMSVIPALPNETDANDANNSNQGLGIDTATLSLTADYQVLDARHPLTWTDSSNTKITAKLSGPGSAHVYVGSMGYIEQIDLSGTTGKTSLTVTTPKGKYTHIARITDDDDLGSLTCPSADLGGTVQLKSAKTIAFKNVSDSSITVGATASAKDTLAATFGVVNILDLESATPLKSLAIVCWLGGDSSTNRVVAPWIGSIAANGDMHEVPAVPGDFMAGVYVSGHNTKNVSLGGLTAKGTIHCGIHDTGGDVGDISTGSGDNSLILRAAGKIGIISAAGSLTATVHANGTIKSVGVAEWLQDSRILALGGISSVTVGGVRNSNIFAGISDTLMEDEDANLPLPADTKYFLNSGDPKKPITLGKLSVVGMKSLAAGTNMFEDAKVSAPALGTISIKNVATGFQSGHVWGLSTSTSIKSLKTGTFANGKWNWNTRQNITQSIAPQGQSEYEVLIV